MDGIDLVLSLFERSPMGISLVTMDGRFVHGNQRLCELYGYSVEELRDMTIYELMYSSDENRQLLLECQSGERDGFVLEKLFRHRDGSPRPVRVSTQMIRDDDGRVVYSLAHIEDRRDELLWMRDFERLALIDPLTGVANQRGLEQFLAIGSQGHVVAVFEIVNYRVVAASSPDQSASMQLVVEVIHRLTSATVGGAGAKAALVARLGLSSFGVGFLGSRQSVDVDAAITRASALVALPFDIGESTTQVRFGIGVAVGHTQDAGPTIDQAASAAELSRQERSGVIVRYHADLVPTVTKRSQRSAELSAAISSRLLRTAIQPIVDLRTLEVIGAEALARWTHPVDGEISPETFIPLAEMSDSIKALTRLVLSDALSFVQRAGDVGRRISVNVTPSVIEDPSFADDVLELLDSLGLDPSVLCLELTESMIVGALPLAEVQVNRLANLGVRWSLDDFGTGYSSLSRLVELPFDEIKIDRRFVTCASADKRCRAVVEGAVGLGQSMELAVVAEGVETPDQARMMVELGVERAQGYLFGVPQIHDRQSNGDR